MLRHPLPPDAHWRQTIVGQSIRFAYVDVSQVTSDTTPARREARLEGSLLGDAAIVRYQMERPLDCRLSQ